MTPKIVFVGPPGAGKSSLVAAFRALASCDPHEVSGEACRVVLEDPARVRTDPVARSVYDADAVVLLIEAKADDAALDERFAAFRRLTEEFADARAFRRDVAGLPVVLTLSKCDELWAPGDDPAEWERKIARRLAYVRQRFADDFDASGFGSLDVSAAATALRFPPDPQFDALAGPYGVRDLYDRTLTAGRDFRTRAEKSARRLRWVSAGTAVLLSVLGVGLAGLAASPFGRDALAERVQAFRDGAGPLPARLADSRFNRNQAELQGIAADTRFQHLPVELREYVVERLQEFDAYKLYRDKFRPPRLGPNDVRSAAELKQLSQAVQGELAPPAGLADTEAGHLYAKWAADVRLLDAAESRLHAWFRDLAREAGTLEQSTAFDDPWREGVRAVIARRAAVPFRPEQPIPESEKLPVRRGAKQTYAPVFEFDRVTTARADADAAVARLTDLRDLTAALGFAGTPGALNVSDSAVSPTERLAALAGRPLSGWAVDRFPEPARGALRARVLASFQAGVRQAKERFEQNPADPQTADWGRFLLILRLLAGEPASDPVTERAEFLKLAVLPVEIRLVEVTVPDDLRGGRAIPAGPLTITVTPRGGTARTYTLTPDGDAPRYVPSGPIAFEMAPTDDVTATAAFRANGAEFRLDWTGTPADKYPFVRLSRDAAGAAGAKLTILPAGGWPTLPVLLH